MGLLDFFKRDKGVDDLGDINLEPEHPGTYDFQSSGEQHAPQMPGPANQDPYASQGFGQNSFSGQNGSDDRMVAKELEIISSKLDSIRAMLESLNQRVGSLERVAYGDQNYGQRRY